VTDIYEPLRKSFLLRPRGRTNVERRIGSEKLRRTPLLLGQPGKGGNMAETFSTSRGTVTVNEPYYLASCDKCGWIGSSEQCGSDYWGDDSDVYCPECFASGADLGKEACAIETAAHRRKSDRAPGTGGSRQ
jgi:hypothetical protein